MKKLLAILTVAVMVAPAMAAPTIDGTADGVYGPAIVVQDTQTSFGDNNNPDVAFANGSELDAAYGRIEGGVLYLVIAGNVESNFNKLEIFIDSVAGGQNQLRGDNPDVDFNGLNRMGDDGGGNGLMFDDGFESDYYITVTGGNDPYELFASYAETPTAGGGVGRWLGKGGAVTDGTLAGGDNPDGILVTVNNSNVAGVDGGIGAASGAGVTTGVELAIPLAAIGSPAGDIKVNAMINGSGHDFLSNQVLGGIGGGDHLGEPRNVNFKNIAGDQFFVVPEPATLALLAFGGIAILRKR